MMAMCIHSGNAYLYRRNHLGNWSIGPILRMTQSLHSTANPIKEVTPVTPLMITLLVIAGIVILIAIGYMNHVVENNKLEKKRTEIELNDRLRRCGEITETFPGQLMTPALKLLLARLELNVNQRLLNLNKSSTPLKARINELNALIAQGESIPVPNPPAPIQTEAKAKDVRFLLEALHGQVTRAAQDGFLPTNEAKHWIKEIRHILVLLHIDAFLSEAFTGAIIIFAVLMQRKESR